MKQVDRNEMQKLAGAEIVRETEKAWQLEVTIDTAIGQKPWKVWFPKSRIEKRDDGMYVPLWLLGAKGEEIQEHFRNGGYYGIVCE